MLYVSWITTPDYLKLPPHILNTGFDNEMAINCEKYLHPETKMNTPD